MVSARRSAVWLVAGRREELEDAGVALARREVEGGVVLPEEAWVERAHFLRGEESEVQVPVLSRSLD